VKNQGENAGNYENPEFDRLFEQMKNMPNSPERQAIIDKLIAILRHDAPWLWGFHPKDYALYHAWFGNLKPNKISYNNVKYQRIDAVQRAQKRREWNQQVLWPLGLLVVLLVAFTSPAVAAYLRRERMAARG
jgi:ABC-type oligopeptide transport system substrate-binding subunit